MFDKIFNALNAGSTGVFVTVILGLEAYLRDRRQTRQQATIDDYLEWLRRQEHRELLEGQRTLVEALQKGDEQAELLRSSIEAILKSVEDQSDVLADICQQVEQIPEVNRKLDLVISQLSQSTSTSGAHQLAIDAHLLDVLAGGLKGAGIRVVMKGPPEMHKEGTLMLVWRMGTQSPHLLLADYVGGLHENRLSLILNPDSSMSLRAYDCDGNQTSLRSPSHAKCEYLIAAATWQGKELSLWSNGTCDGSIRMKAPFAVMGPVLLFGIDIEGTLSADAYRSSPSEMRMGMTYLDYGGLNLLKNGVWHGSRFDCQFVWQRRLQASDIHHLTLQPYTMMTRSRDCDTSIAESTRAIETCADDPGLFIHRAIAWTGKGNYRNAIADYSQAIRLDESVNDAFVLRGVAHNILGNYSEAIGDYRQAIRLDARCTDAHARLAWLLATTEEERFRDSRNALVHAQEAHSLAPWRPDVLNTVAAAFAEARDFTEAVKWQKKAVDTALDDERRRFAARLELYDHRSPYRDHSWQELVRVWRQSQML